jgi:hypothetical protein
MMKKVTSNYASRFRYNFITVLVVLLGLMVSVNASAQTYLTSEQATIVLTNEYKAFVLQQDQMMKTANPAQLKEFQLKELMHAAILRNLGTGTGVEQSIKLAFENPRLKSRTTSGETLLNSTELQALRQFYTDLLSN